MVYQWAADKQLKKSIWATSVVFAVYSSTWKSSPGLFLSLSLDFYILESFCWPIFFLIFIISHHSKLV